MTHITLNRGDEIFISSPFGGGESWIVTQDPEWGIRIEPVGMSRIPKCTALAERPDLHKEMLK